MFAGNYFVIWVYRQFEENNLENPTKDERTDIHENPGHINIQEFTHGTMYADREIPPEIAPPFRVKIQ